MAKRYKLLKKSLTTGMCSTILQEGYEVELKGDIYIGASGWYFSKEAVEENSEWFEEIKEAVTLKEIGEYEEIYPVDPALYVFRLSQPVSDEELGRIKDAIQNALSPPNPQPSEIPPKFYPDKMPDWIKSYLLRRKKW